MVKFSKELEARLIYEWKEAHVDYWKLKKHVKRIKLYQSIQHEKDNNVFAFHIFNFMYYIAQMVASTTCNDTKEIKAPQVEKNVTRKYPCELEVLQSFSIEREVSTFFEQIGEELSKVNVFFESKESEANALCETLKKQLQTISEAKQLFHHCHLQQLPRAMVDFSSSIFLCGDGQIGDTNFPSKENIDDITMHHEIMKKSKPRACQMASTFMKFPLRISRCTSEILETVHVDVGNDGVHAFNHLKRIHCAEKMIRQGFRELYRVLGLLKAYRSLNMLAFTKILKKLDKVVKQQVSKKYFKIVRASHFVSSTKVANLVDEVEHIFTTNFASGDRKKAMKHLCPHIQGDSHAISFLVGLSTGTFLTLFGIYVNLSHITNLFASTINLGYAKYVYPIFSMLALFTLHLFAYGCNLFAWRSARINHTSIFEFSPGSSLKYMDVFLICASLMAVVVGAMVIHLVLGFHGVATGHINAIPGFIFMFCIGLLICPFDVLYRSSRYYILQIIRNIIFSPMYRVAMVDTFMADQLTSQIPFLRHLEFSTCYLLAETFTTHKHQICTSSKLYMHLAYLLSFMPFYWRSMQCARRWFEEGNLNHIANLGKYVSGMLAAGARLTYAMQPSPFWFSMVVATSSIATIYQLYWDFVKDWGLMSPKSKNLWLRDELVLKSKSIYYMSIGLNVVLRLAWLGSVVHVKFERAHYQLFDFVLASLEILRRGLWNFYRLEFEHLNHVGQFKGMKAVSMSFHLSMQ